MSCFEQMTDITFPSSLFKDTVTSSSMKNGDCLTLVLMHNYMQFK